MKCIVCGKEIEKSCYMDVILCSSFDCFLTNFWDNCLDDSALIIDGECYHDGGKSSRKNRDLGFGGRICKIKKKNGEIIETNNLWYNGKVPKERNIEDNAEFI